MIKEVAKIAAQMNAYSKLVILGGSLLGAICLAMSVGTLWFAPAANNYSYMLATSNGFFEAAPACLAVGVICGVICEVVYKKDINIDE